MDIRTNAATEEKYTALQTWWERYKSEFNQWFLKLSQDEKKAVLLKAVPDIPEKSPGTRSATDNNTLFQPTDLLLPEVSLEAFLAADGKIFTLFMQRRLNAQDQGFQSDILLLKDQYTRGILPIFSNGNFNHMDTPFIDPIDPDENIRSLGPSVTEETKTQILAFLATGRLVHAEVWLGLKLRRTALVTLMEAVIIECENQLISNSSSSTDTTQSVTFTPSYLQLLQAELDQVEYIQSEDHETLIEVNTNTHTNTNTNILTDNFLAVVSDTVAISTTNTTIPNTSNTTNIDFDTTSITTTTTTV